VGFWGAKDGETSFCWKGGGDAGGGVTSLLWEDPIIIVLTPMTMKIIYQSILTVFNLESERDDFTNRLQCKIQYI